MTKEEKMAESTVWRLTEADIASVLEDKFPLLTEEEKDYLIEQAHYRFEIFDWVDHVDAFLSIEADEMKRDKL